MTLITVHTRLHQITDRDILVGDPEPKCWLRTSQIEWSAGDGDEIEVRIPEALAIERGLV